MALAPVLLPLVPSVASVASVLCCLYRWLAPSYCSSFKAQGPRGNSQARDLGRRGGGTPTRMDVSEPLNETAKRRTARGRAAQTDVSGNVDARKPDRGGRSASQHRGADGRRGGGRGRIRGRRNGVWPKRARRLSFTLNRRSGGWARGSRVGNRRGPSGPSGPES